MKQELEDLFPAIERGELTKEALLLWQSRIKATIQSEPLMGKTLGGYLASISKAIKLADEVPVMHWQPLSRGAICIGHKPGGKLPYRGMKMAGTDVVFTLLQENEGAKEIGKNVDEAEMEWIWLPFSAARPEETDKAKIFLRFGELATHLQNGKKIYVHCSAGIHRTGMITNALMRYLGMTKAEAEENLGKLRKVTAAQVGRHRLDWGDQFA